MTDVQATGRAGAFRVALLCWLAVVLDGFDMVVLGVLIPVFTGAGANGQAFMTNGEATAVATVSLVGMTIGALGIGFATDYIGRRRALIGAVSAFSVLTLLCAFVQTPFQLGVLRLLAGVGLGGCLPTAIAMVTEFSGGRAGRASTRLMTGYHVGAVATALLGLVLIAPFGWHAMFVAGAIPGLILAPVMWRMLPESPAFLMMRGRTAEARQIAAAHGLVLEAAPAGAGRRVQESLPKAPLRVLLSGRNLRLSIALCAASFMGLLLVYALNAWLPALMVQAHYGLNRGLWFLLLMNVGAVLGMLVAGWVGDRIGLRIAAPIWFFCGGVLLALLAVRMPVAWLYAVIVLTGCFVFSAQVLVYAYAAQAFPTGVRASALGMVAGVGRVGAIVGPLLGGLLVALKIGHPWGFFVFALVGLLGAVALAMVIRAGGRGMASEEAAAHPAE